MNSEEIKVKECDSSCCFRKFRRGKIEIKVPCFFLDDNLKCTIYNERPKVCREWGKTCGCKIKNKKNI